MEPSEAAAATQALEVEDGGGPADPLAESHAPERPAVAAKCVGAVFLGLSLVGLGHAVWMRFAHVVYPFFLHIWLSTFTVLYSCQIIGQGLQLSGRPACLLVHYVILDVVVLVLVVVSFVGFRVDGGVRGALLLLALLANTYFAGKQVQASRRELRPDHLKLPVSGPSCAASVALQALLVVSFPLLAALLGGAWSQAIGYQTFGPRGQFYPLRLPSGEVDVMAYCVGPRNTSLPTFIFDVGGGGHSSSDIYGLEHALVALGRRVCQYDYPGCGWSGYARGVAQPSILDHVIQALGEEGPFIFLGTMDGAADRVYEHALSHPDDVVALIAMELGAGEFVLHQQLRQLGDADAREYARQVTRGRQQIGGVIAGVLVQWGLMGALVPVKGTYVPAELEEEMLFLNLRNEMQWTTQYRILVHWASHPEEVLRPSLWLRDRRLSQRIPVLSFLNMPNVTAQCLRESLDLGGDACNYRRQEVAANYDFNVAMTNMTPASELVLCDDCEGFLSGGGNLQWAVDHIMRFVGDVEPRAERHVA